ncbi:MAG TPA: lipid A export permease/ATP-binding protein MsbA [Methylotenera sp.]|jgi:subfamily B ATP-binding cassette protein MsbA|nr:lipid A export permease/ATP-binding protein MsbA [Methylotenera sp.]
MSKFQNANFNDTKKLNGRALYLRLLTYAKSYWLVLAISIFSLIILSLTNTGFLGTIKIVTDEGFVNSDSNKNSLLPLLLFGLLSLRGLAGFISSFTMRWVGRKVVANLRASAFQHLMHLPISYFDNSSAGVISSHITYDTEQMYNAVTKVAVSTVRDTLTIIGMLSYMVYLDWRLTMIFAVIAPLMALYLKRMTPKLRSSGKNVQETMGEMTQIIEEAIGGQRMVKVFGGELFESQRFNQISEKNRRMMTRLGRISGLNSLVIELLAASALGLVVYYAVGKFSAGEFAAFIGALLMLIAPIKSLTSLNEDLQIAIAASQSIFDIIDTKPEVDTGFYDYSTAKGEIEFCDVSLSYKNSKRPALSHINLKIKAGERIALVGQSGGGKTTLINLLPRFYDLDKGFIKIDGIDVRNIPLKKLREQFSMVSQDVFLFNDTVFNNIAYGALRGINEEQVVAAAKAAHAWDFIQNLPNGLQTEIGDRGVRLSGGQRQRLAIARALLKNAPILLLDEATSALDTESELNVQAALQELMANRTSIVIAHRLSTIENVNRILVMEHGKIVEAGCHEELIALNGHYRRICKK